MLKTPYLRFRVTPKEPGRFAKVAEIAAAVKREMVSGRLPSGGRLPPVRALAHQLRISKNTVETAYRRLCLQGLLENRKRQGFFVATWKSAPAAASRVVPASPVLYPAASSEKTPKGKDAILLSHVFIDADLLPRKEVAECIRFATRSPGLHAFHDAQGFPPLRETIAQRLRKRGIPARAEEIVVTTGSQQALDVVCRALADKKIATENPAYGIGKLLFEMNGMSVTGLPLNLFHGVDLAAWERKLALARPSLLYLTPTFQNPTGYSYSTSELLAVIKLSSRYGFGIVEDDWGSDMLSFSEFKPPLRSLGGENVLYMNSFTKKLLPSLRLGYLVGNGQNVASLIAAKRVSTLGNPTIVETALHEFLQRGYYDAHLQRLQKELDRRYARCIDLLRAVMPPDVRWTTPGGGPILWLEVPRRVDLKRLQADLLRRNVQIQLSDDAFFGPPHLHGFRIGYAFPAPALLQRGIEALGEMLRKAMR